ncbi:STE3-domain-containing protein [Rickenella mellea]|uniref:STE3-domain-containing protein n=1 Tax=Rickenella mellea TaxID=50990 RepID=A0A4Y7PXX6_9AGAM|nr:STE3-domain-containing protein [Rickenella mellea]
MDPTYPLYPIFAFICFILVMIPLPWHLQVWNTGTCMYMIWTGVVCLIQFVNSIVWHGNAINKAPMYCDISTRIVLGAGVAIPACGLCIQRCLYRITSSKTVTSSKEQKIRIFMTDISICLGFPLLIMALTYIVQGHRFSIFEDIGCTPAIYNIWPAYPIYYMWPLVCGLISSVYCALTLQSFSNRRSRFDSLYSSPHSSQRYIRLMLLSATEVVFTVAFSTWVIYANAKEINPYISWTDTHSDFGVVRTFPSMIWHSVHDWRVAVEFNRWNIIICAIVFIAFFTFADETRGNYNTVFGPLAKRVKLRSAISQPRCSDKSSNMVFGNGQSMQSTNCGHAQLSPTPSPKSRNTELHEV